METLNSFVHHPQMLKSSIAYLELQNNLILKASLKQLYFNKIPIP